MSATGLQIGDRLLEPLDAQIRLAQLRRRALQRDHPGLVLLQQAVDRRDVALNLIHRTRRPLARSVERQHLFARLDRLQVLADRVDVREDRLEQRILVHHDPLERIALLLGALRHLPADTGRRRHRHRRQTETYELSHIAIEFNMTPHFPTGPDAPSSDRRTGLIRLRLQNKRIRCYFVLRKPKKNSSSAPRRRYRPPGRAATEAPTSAAGAERSGASNRCAVFAPMPSICSSSLWMNALLRFCRWKAIAKRCTSS